MRTSNVGFRACISAVLKFALAGSLASVAVVATSNSVARQDIISLTNIRSSESNRWLAHLVVIPTGATYAPAGTEKTDKTTGVVSHVMGVQTAEALHVLDTAHVLENGTPQQINRNMMGGRVFTPKPVKTAALFKADTLVTGSVAKNIKTQNSIFSMAQSFQKPKTEIITPADNTVVASKGRVPLPKGEMDQARTVARQMAKVMEKLKSKDILVAANPALRSSAVSYARQDTAQETAMASAFAAVLRPTLKPAGSNKKVLAKKPRAKKSGLKKAVAALARTGRRIKIRLSRGDHKWAAKRLPRNSFSRAQRRCLAVGVYFEARSESRKGQQAVAQVILNRVKNPTYPNSICGVVYQNKWKRNACQFSFACDGIRDRVNSKKHWRKSVKVANAAIDGRVWLRSVGSSSHYHADYVWPRWRRKMRRMVKIGRHIFYRTYGGGWS